VFFADPRAGRNYFRLGFSSIALDRIEPGLRRLADVARRLDLETAPAGFAG